MYLNLLITHAVLNHIGNMVIHFPSGRWNERPGEADALRAPADSPTSCPRCCTPPKTAVLALTQF